MASEVSGAEITNPAVNGNALEGLETRSINKEMNILKDLPSYNSSNFSKFSPHAATTTTTGKSRSYQVKAYFRLKNKSKDEEPQVIVMDSESLILKELEAIITRQQAAKRVSLKRSCGAQHMNSSQLSSSSYKFPRTDVNDNSVDSEDNNM